MCRRARPSPALGEFPAARSFVVLEREADMLVANLRSQFSRADAQFVIALLVQAGEFTAVDAETRLRDEGLDALLDDPSLLRALLSTRLGSCAPEPLFLYVVARHAMLQSGEDETLLADYAASILLHFGLRGRANRIAGADDETYDTVAALIGQVDGPDARRTLLVRAHLGSYALWLAGMFPDYIEHRRWRRGGPPIDYYDEMGQRGFQLASEHRLAHEHGLKPMFALAAERFAVMRVALNKVSDTLMFPDANSPERLMRQVRDGIRWKVS
jgi:hypothetical protein